MGLYMRGAVMNKKLALAVLVVLFLVGYLRWNDRSTMDEI
jgi:hypothetical protein